jgi:hypothetical protein
LKVYGDTNRFWKTDEWWDGGKEKQLVVVHFIKALFQKKLGEIKTPS